VFEPRKSRRALDVFLPALLLAANLLLLNKLWTQAYLDNFHSIEGAFIGFARGLATDGLGIGWWPYWHGGMPVEHVYVPLFHWIVAALIRTFSLSPGQAYHVTGAVFYASGAAAVYLLARALGEKPVPALMAGTLYSLVSSSAHFVPGVFSDLGGHLAGRRLQVMFVYGEGPHVASLAIQALALGAVHRLLATGKWRWAAAAGALAAAVIMINTPATMALAVGVLVMLAVHLERVLRLRAALQLAAVALLACGLAVWAVPPSYLRTVLANSTEMNQRAGAEANRWVICGLLLLAIVAIAHAARPLSVALRFSLLYSIALVVLAAPAQSEVFELLPQAGRLQVELEIGLSILLAAAFARVGSWRAALVVCCVAAPMAVGIYGDLVQRVRLVARPVAAESKSEYQAAVWLASRSFQGRVYAPGSHAFWMNAFAPVPLLTGCCEEGRSSKVPALATEMTNLAQSDEEVARAIALLKALGVEWIVAPTGKSTEVYRDLRRPDKFGKFLPLEATIAGDLLYRLPSANPALAAAVPRDRIVNDFRSAEEVARFNESFESNSNPAAGWAGNGHYRASLTKREDEVISIKISAVDGWDVTVNGARAAYRKDGLGWMVIDSRRSGGCTAELRWRPRRLIGK